MIVTEIDPRMSGRLARVALAASAALGFTAAHAQATGEADSNVLQEVVVTAQFKAENIQDTPIAITAVTAEMIEQRSVTNILDIAAAAPNVTMRLGSTGFGKSNQAFIRGVGQGDFLLTYSPRVSFYIDDVYHSTVFGSVFDILDVDRVEVLRGPQGTLFGRNAVGGAIRLFSKKPLGDNTGYIEIGSGSYRRQSVRGVLDVPLVQDKLMMRFSGGYRAQDGWVDHYNWGCVYPQFAGALRSGLGTSKESNGCKDGTLGGSNVLSARLQLRFVGGERFENNLTFDYMNDRSDATTDVMLQTPGLSLQNPTTGIGNGARAILPGQTTPTAIPASQVANGLALWFATVGGPKYGIPLTGTRTLYRIVGAPPGSPPGTPGTAVPIATPSDELLASLISGRRDVSYAAFGNLGLSRPANGADPGAAFVDPNINDLESKGIGNVFDWRLTDHVNLKAITGYREYIGRFGSSQASLPVPVQEAYQEVTHRQFSQELQFSGTTFGDRLDWAGGLFYIDTRDVNSGRVQFEGFGLSGNTFVQDFNIDDPATLENKSAFLHGIYHFTDHLDAEAGVRYSHETKTYTFFRLYSFFLGLPPPALPNFTRGVSTTDERWNPRVSINYNFSNDVMLYTSYATGFTAGGFNGRPFSQADVFPYDPEDVKSYEVGFKSELFGRTVRLNGAVYYMKWNDRQITLGCIGQPNCPHPATPFYNDNGGDAIVKGFELETEAYPTENWLITASVGYKDFKWDKLSPFAAPLTLASPDIGVPDRTIAVGTQYTFHLGNFGTLTPRLDANYQSEEFWTATDLTNSYLREPSYWLENARLTWRSPDEEGGGWQVALAVLNLSDKTYFTGRTDSRTGFGYATGTVAQPRVWQVNVRKSFK
jgi:iron complex outermembrane recepter protein